MVKIETEEIPEMPGLVLASAVCDEGGALSFAEVGAALQVSGLVWVSLAQVCDFWGRRLGEPLGAAVVVTACPDLPPGVASVILGYPHTKRHGHSLVHHEDIVRYHWPRDVRSRKFLAALT